MSSQSSANSSPVQRLRVHRSSFSSQDSPSSAQPRTTYYDNSEYDMVESEPPTTPPHYPQFSMEEDEDSKSAVTRELSSPTSAVPNGRVAHLLSTPAIHSEAAPDHHRYVTNPSHSPANEHTPARPSGTTSARPEGSTGRNVAPWPREEVLFLLNEVRRPENLEHYHAGRKGQALKAVYEHLDRRSKSAINNKLRQMDATYRALACQTATLDWQRRHGHKSEAEIKALLIKEFEFWDQMDDINTFTDDQAVRYQQERATRSASARAPANSAVAAAAALEAEVDGEEMIQLDSDVEPVAPRHPKRSRAAASHAGLASTSAASRGQKRIRPALSTGTRAADPLHFTTSVPPSVIAKRIDVTYEPALTRLPDTILNGHHHLAPATSGDRFGSPTSPSTLEPTLAGGSPAISGVAGGTVPSPSAGLHAYLDGRRLALEQLQVRHQIATEQEKLDLEWARLQFERERWERECQFEVTRQNARNRHHDQLRADAAGPSQLRRTRERPAGVDYDSASDHDG